LKKSSSTDNYPDKNKENVRPFEKTTKEHTNFQYKKPEIKEKVFFEDFKETASEEVELIEDNNDLICEEKIQDRRYQGRSDAFPKEKKEMPNITEETDEDMSNNCSPNKNEVINLLINQRKFESILLIIE